MPVFPCQSCSDPVGLSDERSVILCHKCRARIRGETGLRQDGKTSMVQEFICSNPTCKKKFYRYPAQVTGKPYCSRNCYHAERRQNTVPKLCWCGKHVKCKGLCNTHYNQTHRPPTGRGNRAGYLKMLFADEG